MGRVIRLILRRHQLDVQQVINSLLIFIKYLPLNMNTQVNILMFVIHNLFLLIFHKKMTRVDPRYIFLNNV